MEAWTWLGGWRLQCADACLDFFGMSYEIVWLFFKWFDVPYFLEGHAYHEYQPPLQECCCSTLEL
jgi:hypothetical protein